ncbi:MAG: M15 family metallopeptidase [Clostridia bacterium]|nr:M15 family metallopeptidase [Clostridia bacterium]
MSRKRKKSRAVPVVAVLTFLVVALCVACFLINPLVIEPQRKAIAEANEAAKAEVEQKNREIMAEYQATLAELESKQTVQINTAWPEHASDGWDILDLSSFPLENPTAETKTRAELMANGMLLINEWHSRPDDFDDSGVVSVTRYLEKAVQASDANVSMFPVAARALKEAVDAAAAQNLTHYMVDEAYRSWDTQNTLFQNRLTKLSTKYSGDELIAATKKEVNYPGTSEYNSGLAFRLRLYDRNDPEVASPKYSTTEQGKWMNENCWKYGIVFRFPQANWPLDNTMDKSFKTGVSLKMNLYRYVGKGNAAIMHYKDFCMEEYIEYLEEHPHIALFEDGTLKYEIYRQYVGDAASFNVQLTRNARSHESSLDNMGGIITVFEY